jgi:ATP-dependent DNA helicase RecQ
MTKDCGYCDNCLHPKERFDGQDYVLIALQAVEQTGQRFGIGHLVNVIKGSVNQYVKSYGHDQLKVYGKGNQETDELWKSVVRQTLLAEFIAKDIDNVGVLILTDKGKSFLKKPYPIELTRDHDYNDLGEEEESDQEILVGKAYDEGLFEILKKLRKTVAKEKGLPPFVIFNDPSLEEMATTYPTSMEELEEVIGVGKGKAAKFGKDFIDTISAYVEENEITTATDVRIKSEVNKSRNKVFIIQQIDKKIELEEIADSRKLSMEALLEEIESIISSGTKLNLDYYIDQVVDYDKQEELHDYFLNSETGSIDAALDDEDLEDYTEEEIRLMRIKFLCEYAH